jgi:putative ABC transport system permease protein
VTGAWTLAWRGLARNRRRNLTTGLAIALAYAGLLVMGGYANRVENMLRTDSVYVQHNGHLVLHREQGFERAAARPAAYSFTPEEQQAIARALTADGRVEFWGRSLRASGLAGNGCTSVPFRALGVEPEVARRIIEHPEVRRWTPELVLPVAGVPLSDGAGVGGAVMLSTGLAAALHKEPSLAKPPDRPGPAICGQDGEGPDAGSDSTLQLAGLTFEGSLSATDAQVVGVFHAPTRAEDQSALVADLEVLQRLLETDRVTSVAVYLRDARDTAAVSRSLEARLARAGVPATVHRFDDAEANPVYVGTMGFLAVLVGFIGSVVAAVAGFSVLNATTLAVIERTREMGTLRSLGFTRPQVLALFLREATVLAALGVLAGAALGLLWTLAVNQAGIRFTPPGAAGTIQLLLRPTPVLFLGLAILVGPLTLAATWIAVRRRLRRGVCDLLTMVAT